MPKTKKPSTKQTEDLQKRITELENNYKRALADYQNLIKQSQKERHEYIKFATCDLITQILPLLDNLQLAYKHTQDPGIEMIIKQFKQIIADEHVHEINPTHGTLFDENLHEAIDTVDGDEQQENQIAETAQIGYQYKDGPVLRHAKVKVYQTSDEINEQNKQ